MVACNPSYKVSMCCSDVLVLEMKLTETGTLNKIILNE